MSQTDLFAVGPVMPEGFRYRPDLIGPEDERALIEVISELPFRQFEFQGFRGKRRVVSFGWQYDFNDRKLEKADDIPSFLTSLRTAAAQFADISPADLQHALVTEYSPGAAIGWHRDKSMFGDVVGVSLLSCCIFRLRRRKGTKWERASIRTAPRSGYLLRGPARTEWEHSIPEVEKLRYSVTFRTLLSTPALGFTLADGQR